MAVGEILGVEWADAEKAADDTDDDAEDGDDPIFANEICSSVCVDVGEDSNSILGAGRLSGALCAPDT